MSKKNIKYVTFEIKSKDLYPVKMSGLFENYDAKDFNYTNADTFIKSFFEKGVYTPFIDGNNSSARSPERKCANYTCN